MKLLFSEASADYAHYVFPYAVWAFPEAQESPADLLNAGFLPSTHALDRFYLCRHTRVRLDGFQPSSENRRVLRKHAVITSELVGRKDFELTPERRNFCLAYTKEKFGDQGMTEARLNSLFENAVTTHILVFRDEAGAEVGYVTLYLEGTRAAYYYYAFYSLHRADPGLGMFMMTTAVDTFSRTGLRYLYLGTCYTANALYKSQFSGFEFFNGHRWSDSLPELKFLLARADGNAGGHLLESEAYRTRFLKGELRSVAAPSPFRGTSAESSGG